MFCNNCGQQNAEGVRFCSSCGAPLMADAPAQAPVDADATVRVRVQPPVQEQYAPVQQAPYQAPVEQYAPVQQAPYQAPVQEAPYQAPVQQAPYQAPADPYAVPQYGAPAPQKSNGKMIGIIVGVVAAIAAVVVVLVLVLGGGSSGGASTPEEIAEKYIIAQAEYDADGLVDCMADVTLLQTSKMLGYDEVNKDAVIERLESTIPDDAEKKDCEIISATRDDSQINFDSEIAEMKAMFGEEAVKNITEITVVKIKAKIDGETEEFNVTCVKENGSWKVAG